MSYAADNSNVAPSLEGVTADNTCRQAPLAELTTKNFGRPESDINEEELGRSGTLVTDETSLQKVPCVVL